MDPSKVVFLYLLFDPQHHQISVDDHVSEVDRQVRLEHCFIQQFLEIFQVYALLMLYLMHYSYVLKKSGIKELFEIVEDGRPKSWQKVFSRICLFGLPWSLFYPSSSSSLIILGVVVLILRF